MYVEIGNYQVQEGELLPTKDLSDTYVFECEMSDEDIYTILMVDTGPSNPENPGEYPLILFLMVNIADNNGKKEGDVVFEYLPPSPPPHSKLHQYQIHVFKQDCRIEEVRADGRVHFDIQGWTDCPLEIIEKFVFYGSENLDSFEEQDNTDKSIDLFTEYYTDDLSNNDMLILANVYGLNTLDLSEKDIRSEINKILSYQNNQ